MHRRRTIATLMLAALLFAGSPALADRIQPGEAQKIAKEAYIALYPLVMNYRIMHRQAIDNRPGHLPEGFGIWAHRGLSVPGDNDITMPNVDTHYSWAWVDLRAEPWVLTLPAVDEGRYYTSQWNDLWGYVLDNPGTIEDGNSGGSYLLVPPGWKGDLPKGVKRAIKGESVFLGTLTRTELLSGPDLPTVEMIQRAYLLRPLSQFLHTPPPEPAPKIQWPAWNEDCVTDLSFFSYANFLLRFTHPNPKDKELFTRMAAIGIAPGKPWEPGKMNPGLRKAIQAGVKDAAREIMENAYKVEYFNKLFVGSRHLDTTYMDRATGAYLHPFGNIPRQAAYVMVSRDSKGEILSGDRFNYTMSFHAGSAPPSRFFWSITVYGMPDRTLVPNPLSKYSIGTHSLTVVKNHTGSFTLYFQKDSPGKDKELNWIPVPQGNFVAVLRAYGPDHRVINHAWKLPPLVRGDTTPAQ